MQKRKNYIKLDAGFDAKIALGSSPERCDI
jgi:hypothetical protein